MGVRLEGGNVVELEGGNIVGFKFVPILTLFSTYFLYPHLFSLSNAY